MRYNPDTDQGNSIDEVANQCRVAIGGQQAPLVVELPRWAELSAMHIQTNKSSPMPMDRSWLNCCQLSHDMVVAAAMGNFPEHRRLRAQLIAGLW
jgi:hypothetical protein